MDSKLRRAKSTIVIKHQESLAGDLDEIVDKKQTKYKRNHNDYGESNDYQDLQQMFKNKSRTDYK